MRIRIVVIVFWSFEDKDDFMRRFLERVIATKNLFS